MVGVVTSCTLVAGSWQGMAVVDRRAAKEGADLRIFPLPPGEQDAGEKTCSTLGVLDRALLPECAVVLPQFPKLGAMRPARTA